VTRDELVALLARLVADGKLTEPEAAGLVARYDAGELPSVALPATPSTPQPVGGVQGDTPEAIGANFDVVVARLAAALVSGQMTLAAWQAQMATLVADEMLSQALLGSDGDLAGEDMAELEADAAEQAAYVSRFADEMALGLLIERPMSEGQIAARSALYAGVGWGWYFRAYERRLGKERGIVVRYVAHDDDRTCGPCHEAEAGSPYLPDAGPFPGDVCAGGGRCRCRREEYYDMEAWQRLTGA